MSTSCIVCMNAPAVQQDWCSCTILCRCCIREMAAQADDGRLVCTSCRRTRPPSARMRDAFFTTFFDGNGKVIPPFADVVLSDDIPTALQLTRFLKENNMDCRWISHIIAKKDVETCSALLDIDVDLFPTFPEEMRFERCLHRRVVEARPHLVSLIPNANIDIVRTAAERLGHVILGRETNFRDEEWRQLLDVEPAQIVRLKHPTAEDWDRVLRQQPALVQFFPAGGDTRSLRLECYPYLDTALRVQKDVLVLLLEKQEKDDSIEPVDVIPYVLFDLNEELRLKLLKHNPQNIKYLPEHTRKEALCAVESDGQLLMHTNFRHDFIVCHTAIKENALAIQWVIDEHLKTSLSTFAIGENKDAVALTDWRSFPYFLYLALPNSIKIPGATTYMQSSILEHEIRKDPSLLQYVSHEDQTQQMANVGEAKYVSPFFTGDIDRETPFSLSVSASESAKRIRWTFDDSTKDDDDECTSKDDDSESEGDESDSESDSESETDSEGDDEEEEDGDDDEEEAEQAASTSASAAVVRGDLQTRFRQFVAACLTDTK